MVDDTSYRQISTHNRLRFRNVFQSKVVDHYSCWNQTKSPTKRNTLKFLMPGCHQWSMSNCPLNKGVPAKWPKLCRNGPGTKRIKLSEWPGNLPDLNPIKSLWELMKRRVASKCPKNLQDFIYCLKLAKLMPKRIPVILYLPTKDSL